MPVQYTNRKGETYFVLAGKTKTGKPKYYTSKKSDGTLVEELPAGYEIHESPVDGQVHIRKIRPTRLLPIERKQVEQAIRSLANLERFIVDVDEDAFVVYLPGDDIDRAASIFADTLGGGIGGFGFIKDVLQRHATYTAMMRFSLVDPDERHFVAERWCFRGNIERWRFLDGPDTLGHLLDEFAPHLGQESFYDLM